ncbi:MAG: ABC transporter ATP-binding protein [Deltaproteobacteria bacterium]|nr:ABC transporter ATP-binding protein [Deltaproteobacteria bacterium]
MTPAAPLAARALSFRYARGPLVLDGLDVEAAPGSVLAVVGPNGAGKSTLLRLLAGLLAPTAGDVLLGGAPLRALPSRERARRVAVALAAPPGDLGYSALEIALMGRVPHLGGLARLESAADHALAHAALSRCRAGHLAARPFGALSSGERQRVLLARALCQDAPALLLDEPTSHQDPAHALAIAALCRELAAEGRVVVCVLHDLNLALDAADHALVLRADGRAAATGPTRAVLTPDLVTDVYGVAARRLRADDGRAVLVLGPGRGDGAEGAP